METVSANLAQRDARIHDQFAVVPDHQLRARVATVLLAHTALIGEWRTKVPFDLLTARWGTATHGVVAQWCLSGV
jgi:hypothetical protein